MPSSLKVVILTESRADYGIYYPLLKTMSKDSRFELQLMIAGMHWDEAHGKTVYCVELDFPDWVLDWFDPDWLVVLGDRRPMLEATIRAAYDGIPIAHIQGGDRTGTIDDSARHAITHFANLHFPCTEQSAQRLIRMGEEEWRIKVVGPLGIYAMPEAEFLSKQQICEKLGLDASREIVLIIQHPVSTQVAQAGEQMRSTLEAVKDYQSVIIYPNNDPGNQEMIKVIEDSGIKAFKSLPYLEFLSLLKASNVIVGNSSTGLYEAGLFGIQAVNVGNRQMNREHGSNVENVTHNAAIIRMAITEEDKAWQRFYSNPFSSKIDGVKVILDTLANTLINERLLQKRVTY